jgi:hypothetical protein
MSKALKIIISVVVALALVGGTVGLITAIDSGKFDTKKISPLNFSVGGLDSTGSYMDTDGSIYTKDAFECAGLTCTLDFDALIAYQIYFYDQNNDFVHTTGKLTTAFVPDSIPFFAKFARVVITPTEDEKVTTLEVLGYAKQLNIKVFREQGYKNFTENLFEVEQSGVGVGIVTSDGTVTTTLEGSVQNTSVCKLINVSGYEEMMVFRASSENFLTNVFFYGVDKTYLGYGRLRDISTVMFTSSEGVLYYGVSFASLSYDSPVGYVRLACYTNDLFEVYCR